MSKTNTDTARAGQNADQTAARGNRRQKLVVGRMVDGELHVIADVVPFVSSRLGRESISRETEQERDPEFLATARALHSLSGVGQ